MHKIYGDILEVREGIVVHQVNCRRVMGAGLAKKIREAYPQHYTDYMHTAPALGKIVCTKVNNSMYVVGVYGQDGYGRIGCYTDYHALRVALKSVHTLSRQLKLNVYLPYGIGCGLAGGDWSVVSSVIEESIPDAIILRKV